jgi:hypothetical protein
VHVDLAEAVDHFERTGWVLTPLGAMTTNSAVASTTDATDVRTMT